MSTPGSNILKRALRLIKPSTFLYNQFKTRETNAIGYDVSVYYPSMQLSGSVQPVPRNVYAEMGLLFQKNYYIFYISHDALDISRDISGDQIQFNGLIFNCISKTNWFSIDGWDGILAVAVTP